MNFLRTMVCTTRKLKQYNENIARNPYAEKIPRVHFIEREEFVK